MITTHVLDIARGAPAGRLPVDLDVFISGQGWREAGHGLTNESGRIDDFGEAAAPGVYRMVFDVASYMPHSFFPSIAITFEIHDAKEHYHIPILLSPFGYTVYRGN